MIDIIYSDESIVICVKPVGIDSEHEMPEELQKLIHSQIFTVHRLDTAVGGIMIYAKNTLAAGKLSKQIQDGSFVKHYLALTEGVPENNAVLEDLLFKDSRKNKSYVVNRMRKGVKAAKLEYSVKETNDNFALLEIRLYTGRSHQIRVQLSSRGFPLVGDGKYGAKDSNCPIGLFSSKIEFTHPVTAKQMAFSVEPCFEIAPWNKIKNTQNLSL